MTPTLPVINRSLAQQYLDQLDLSYIVDSMCATSYALPRWLPSEAQQCAQLYKNFLWLCKKHGAEALVPTREIDEFWHNHILFTRRYQRDCQHIFGAYLHHEPSSPDEDPQALIRAFTHTKALYLSEFNQPLILLQAASQHS